LLGEKFFSPKKESSTPARGIPRSTLFGEAKLIVPNIKKHIIVSIIYLKPIKAGRIIEGTSNKPINDECKKKRSNTADVVAERNLKIAIND
jgi:hypothetical protein